MSQLLKEYLKPFDDTRTKPLASAPADSTTPEVSTTTTAAASTESTFENSSVTATTVHEDPTYSTVSKTPTFGFGAFGKKSTALGDPAPGQRITQTSETIDTFSTPRGLSEEELTARGLAKRRARRLAKKQAKCLAAQSSYAREQSASNSDMQTHSANEDDHEIVSDNHVLRW